MASSGTSRRGAVSTLHLRTLAGLGAASLLFIAVVALMALLLLTRFTRRHLRVVQETMVSMRAAEGLRVALLAYGRESDLAYLTRSAEAEMSRKTMQADLLSRIGQARRDLRAPQEARLIEKAEAEIRAYLELRRHAEHEEKELQKILVRATAPLQRSLDTLQELERIELQAVTNAQATASEWERTTNLAGSMIVTLLVVAFCAILVGMRRMVFAPLLSLSDGIHRFTRGERTARVAVRGPEEFRQAAMAFNGMLNQLAEQEKQQRTFLAGVAHDLRNPLTALRLRVQLLTHASQLPPEDKLRAAFHIAERQIQRLERMVGDFLDASQIERGHLELKLQTYDLRNVARDCIELYHPSAVGHVLTLSIPEHPLLVRCDPSRIDQVLDNLVSNAIKYSPRGGEVEVSVTEVGGRAIVAVTDHGIGIPAGELQHVFEPYRRVGASRELAPGLGLGLFVAQRIVQAHGGDIEVESRIGVGTTFRVCLPLLDAASAGASAEAIPR